MLIDRQGRCLRTNKFGLAMMQVSENELKGKDFRELWPEDIRPRVDEAMRKVLGNSQCAFEAYQLNGPEKQWVTVALAPIADDKGEVAKFISIASDITYRKIAEEERIAAYEQRLAMEKQHTREKEQLLMDLHDGIGGIATNISIIAAMGQQATDREGMKNALASVGQLSTEAISEIRSFMHSLDTNELNWRSLAAELKHQGTQMVEPHGISFAFTASISEVGKGPGGFFWVNLFKIYKEALINVIRHAKAAAVTVDLTVGPSGFQLIVRDNGVGWVEQHETGRGIANIRKRAGAMGGQVTLSSNGGLQIDLAVPLHGTASVSGGATA